MNSHNLSMMVSPARRIQKLISGNTTLFPTPKHKIRSVARARKTQQKRKATESRLKRVAEIQDSLKRRNEIQQGKEWAQNGRNNTAKRCLSQNDRVPDKMSRKNFIKESCKKHIDFIYKWKKIISETKNQKYGLVDMVSPGRLQHIVKKFINKKNISILPIVSRMGKHEHFSEVTSFKSKDGGTLENIQEPMGNMRQGSKLGHATQVRRALSPVVLDPLDLACEYNITFQS